MAQSDFYLSAAAKQLEALEVSKADQLAQLRSYQFSNDLDGAAETVQQLADIERAQENLRSLCESYVQSAQPRQPHVSNEVRQARGPNEMDAQDMANVLNESRYSRLGSGRPFSADDYNRLRSGLNPYKAARGIESK